jgi:hypothetical protein
VNDLQIPQSTYGRIKEELDWVVIPSLEKFTRLMQIDHYSRLEFRRLSSYLTELLRAGELSKIEELANHYFAILESDVVPQPEELGRVPELAKVISGLPSHFWSITAKRLSGVAVRWEDNGFLHNQVLNAILAICRTLATYEDFEQIENIGNVLERQVAELPEHQACCGKTLQSMVYPQALDRIIELYIVRRDDRNFGRIASVLLRRAAVVGISKSFIHLEDETVAAVRMSLLRLIERIGVSALTLARERINDTRWFVVRNSCKLLGDLKDPELTSHIMPALKHVDERVQKAAVTAVLDSRHPDRAAILSEALPFLHPLVMEDVFHELMFLRDPNCLPALEHLVFHESRGIQTLTTCVQTIATIPGAATNELLLRVTMETRLHASLRRTALQLLVRDKSAMDSKEFRNFTLTHAEDPIAREAHLALAASENK